MKGGKLLVLVGVMLLAISLVAIGCPAAPTTTAPTTTAPTTTAPEVKTLKVGLLCNFGWPLGLDMKKFLDAVVPAYNEAGGLAIGGDRYKIDLIEYDSKNDPETARAAVERMVYQDEVKFILGDITADAWISLTEENKVVSILSTNSPAALSPNLKYTFQGSYLNTSTPVIWAWFAEKYPEMKTVVNMSPDALQGHADAGALQALFPTLGLELADIVYYPPETTDFSAFATKVMASNPQVFCSAGGGTIQDYLSVKFVREAGYEGLVFMYRGVDPGGWSKVGPLDPVNGTIGPLMYTYLPPELMPAITKESKDAYIAKYGSWDDPVALFAFTWYVLQDALEKAQSLDPDKVAQVMASGLKFDTAYGPGMMISRPDQDNPRTIDALYEFTMATLEEGEIKVLDQVSADKAFELIKKYEIFGVYPD